MSEENARTKLLEKLKMVYALGHGDGLSGGVSKKKSKFKTKQQKYKKATKKKVTKRKATKKVKKVKGGCCNCGGVLIDNYYGGVLADNYSGGDLMDSYISDSD